MTSLSIQLQTFIMHGHRDGVDSLVTASVGSQCSNHRIDVENGYCIIPKDSCDSNTGIGTDDTAHGEEEEEQQQLEQGDDLHCQNKMNDATATTQFTTSSDERRQRCQVSGRFKALLFLGCLCAVTSTLLDCLEKTPPRHVQRRIYDELYSNANTNHALDDEDNNRSTIILSNKGNTVMLGLVEDDDDEATKTDIGHSRGKL